MSTPAGKLPVTLFDIRNMPSMDIRRAGKVDAMITYDVDPLHRYFITVPLEEVSDAKGGYDEAKVAAHIRVDMEARARIVGKQLMI